MYTGASRGTWIPVLGTSTLHTELAPGNPRCSQRWKHPRFERLCPSCTVQHTSKMPLVFFTFSRVLRLAGV
eukprot:6502149-Pyramimonas_sp.AAC.1